MNDENKTLEKVTCTKCNTSFYIPKNIIEVDVNCPKCKTHIYYYLTPNYNYGNKSLKDNTSKKRYLYKILKRVKIFLKIKVKSFFN